MRFEFILRDALPRLAWCARLRHGSEVVLVQHGAWVETAADWFVEGAWAGAFDGGDVVETSHLVGTAGRAEPGHVVFCSPSSLTDRVLSVRVGDELHVSNSAVFLLRITDDAPDPRHPYYTADRLRQLQCGIRFPDKRLRTARGRRILVHDHCNLVVRPDLALRRVEKPTTPSPLDYADYVGQLDQLIHAVLANAADPARRRQRYRAVATLSRGYDSGALAVLLRRHGAREAITFTERPEDDGTRIGERLGYEVTGYDPLGFRRLPDLPEAEFLATPPGLDVPMVVCEAQLAGALLVTGRSNGPILETRRTVAPLLYSPSGRLNAGTTMSEFRLRVGFLQFPPYFLGAVHPEALHGISISPEMKPWSVGGVYDKPIARRLLEEAGIPRDWFGQRKRASAFQLMRFPGDLNPASAADFAAYRRTLPPITRRRRWTHRALLALRRARIDGLRRTLHAALRLPPPRRLSVYPITVVSLEMGFAFHWAYARIRSRYDAAAEPGPSAPAPLGRTRSG